MLENFLSEYVYAILVWPINMSCVHFPIQNKKYCFSRCYQVCLLNKMFRCLQIQVESLKTLLLLCMCVVVWNLLMHSLRWSKFIWIFNLLKIWVLYKAVENSRDWNFKTTGCFALRGFWKRLKVVWLGWLCCQTKSIDCFY